MRPQQRQMGTTRTDPVCGMAVDLDRPRGGKVVYQGGEMGFCSLGCKKKFEADPGNYLGGKKAGPDFPAPAGPIEWTCPMHPEIVRGGPGSCPICGMALEPRTLNMFTLIALGTAVAYGFSLVATVAPGIFPETMRRQGCVCSARNACGSSWSPATASPPRGPWLPSPRCSRAPEPIAEPPARLNGAAHRIRHACAPCEQRRGRCTTKIAPRPGSLSTSMRPPCAWTICRAM